MIYQLMAIPGEIFKLIMKIIDRLKINIIYNNQSGFTLVELIIALSVFTVGIMAAFSLSLANTNAAQENYFDILGANLAREGIELTRNIRDNNWLKIEANEDCDGNPVNGRQICTWRQDLTSDGLKVAYNLETTSLVTGYLIDVCYGNGTCRLYRDASNFYSHDIAGSPTNFARVIYLMGICLDISGNEYVEDEGPACYGGDTQIGLQVMSLVRWYRGSNHRDIRIYDNIYNWQDYVD